MRMAKASKEEDPDDWEERRKRGRCGPFFKSLNIDKGKADPNSLHWIKANGKSTNRRKRIFKIQKSATKHGKIDDDGVYISKEFRRI